MNEFALKGDVLRDDLKRTVGRGEKVVTFFQYTLDPCHLKL
jgi:hypothetical protein